MTVDARTTPKPSGNLNQEAVPRLMQDAAPRTSCFEPALAALHA